MLVYDFETFRYDWLVVFKNTSSLSYTVIVNDIEKLREFYENNKHEIHVGYNNKGFDNVLYKAMLDGANPYRVTQMIIAEDNLMGVYRQWNLNKTRFPSVDMIQDLGHVGLSLKEYEGFKGMDIDESSVPFDIERPLTSKEIDETIRYCKSDVDATHQLLLDKIDVVKTKMTIIREFNLTKSDLICTNAQLIAKVLGASKKSYDDEHNPFDFSKIQVDSVLDLRGKVYNGREFLGFETVGEFYGRPYHEEYKEKLVVDLFDMEITFAFGGLHGAIPNFHYKGLMWLDDVRGYYPSNMIENMFLSRSIAPWGFERFSSIKTNRDVVKFTDPDKANAYKLLTNIAFGASNAKFNDMYDPHQANNVCVSGQLMLMQLALNLAPYAKIVQLNTDGVLYIPYNQSECQRVSKEWSEKTSMGLDTDVFKALYQKDVNNYISVEEDDSITVKGSYVRQTTINGNKPRTLTNTSKIIDDAVVNYFVNGISPEKTIIDCTNRLDFQIIRKTGRTYDGTVYEYNGKDYPCNYINRVYATKDTRHGKLYKVRKDGTRSQVPSLPDHCELSNKNTFDMVNLDRQYYIDEAWKRIKDFK